MSLMKCVYLERPLNDIYPFFPSVPSDSLDSCRALTFLVLVVKIQWEDRRLGRTRRLNGLAPGRLNMEFDVF